LFGYEWKLTKSPAGAQQWTPTDANAKGNVPDAHDPKKSHAPMMFTTDMALKMDPAYAKISKRFHENPKDFAAAFAKAWYKLTHRDMGPVSRCLGPLVPEVQVWQDPVPAVDHKLIENQDIVALKKKILASGFSCSQFVSTAWASASTFRGTDKRGGANGARIRLAPQKDWKVNNPAELAKILPALEKIQKEFNGSQEGGKKVSMADLIVLAGCAAVEDAAKKAGHDVSVPFFPGRTDASQDPGERQAVEHQRMRSQHQTALDHLRHDLGRASVAQPFEIGIGGGAHHDRQLGREHLDQSQQAKRTRGIVVSDHQHRRPVHTGGQQGLAPGRITIDHRLACGSRLANTVGVEIERHEGDAFGLQNMSQALAAATITADDDVAITRQAARRDRRQLQRSKRASLSDGLFTGLKAPTP
jgi:hypothetical protein